MKKEEIIIQAFRLCEELKTLGFDSSVNVSSHVDSITVQVWAEEDESMENILRIYAYFHDKYRIDDSTQSIKSVIPSLQNLINQQKQIA